MDSLRYKKSHVIVLVLIIILIPFALNFLLQCPVNVAVIGDEETWLTFWGSYIGVILTAMMVAASFLTIRASSNFNMSQRQVEWLRSFRMESSQLISLSHPNYSGVLAQKLACGFDKEVMEEGVAHTISLQRTIYSLNALLMEYNSLFNETNGKEFIKTIEKLLAPYIRSLNELVQFAVINDYMSTENITPERYKTVIMMKDDMIKDECLCIAEALEQLSLLSYSRCDFKYQLSTIKATCIGKITSNLTIWKHAALTTMLLDICECKANSVHSYSFFMRTKQNNNICQKEK